jgi:phosphatidylglycerol:prolipoprotein diacylglycerol transferase
MILEGLILFLAMFFFWKKHTTKTQTGYLSALFLIGYSLARLIAEQFRLPDAHVGYLLGTSWLTLGILYTLPMLIFGIYLF